MLRNTYGNSTESAGKEQKMRIEKSCGAVIFTYKDGQRCYLIEHTASGNTSIPKGHIEDGETEVQTALREIREETNLEVELDTAFRFCTHYRTRKGREKDVVFFIAVPKTWDLKPQAEEVRSFEWLPLEQALQTLEYLAHKEALRKADEYLQQKQGR